MASNHQNPTDVASEAATLYRQERYWEFWQSTRSVSEWAASRDDFVLEMVRGLGLYRPKILDLGCGTGRFTEELAYLGDATGVDLSRKATDAGDAGRNAGRRRL